ncbi:MAG: hypothetical protein LBG62_00590 [Candidatus Methanoplasma sp.]|jgi:hypothetical protein|nr:hypothetical protein [Candidatus Methanoplasma sp.]
MEKKDAGFAYMVAGAFYSVALIAWMFFVEAYIALSFVGILVLFTVPFMAIGIDELNSKGNETPAGTENRGGAATGWSFIPGLGLVYLGRTWQGAAMFAMFIASFAAYSVSLSSGAQGDAVTTMDAATAYGGMILITLLSWSVVETFIACDEKGLARPREKSKTEIDIRHPFLWLFTVLLTSFSLISGATFYFLTGSGIDVDPSVCALAVCFSLIVLARAIVLATRRECRRLR